MISILVRSRSTVLVDGEILEVEEGDVADGDVAERPLAEARALMQLDA